MQLTEDLQQFITNKASKIDFKDYELFYEANKEAIDNGTIVGYWDPNTSEAGIVMDKSTGEVLAFDGRN